MPNMKMVTGGPELRADCKNYDWKRYRDNRSDNTADVAIIRLNGDRLECLMVKRGDEPFKGQWAFPGGFLNKTESLDEAAVRELGEETGAKGIPVKQMHTYGKVDRDPRHRVITTFYYALVRQSAMSKQKIKAADDAVDTCWMDIRNPDKNLAFDHNRIMRDLVNELESQAQYNPVAFQLVEKDFTWNEIQKAYTALLGRPVLNIRRKLNTFYKIKDTGEFRRGRSRPASVLNFVGINKQF